MTILNLHHLGVPCKSAIRKLDSHELTEKAKCFNLNNMGVSDKTILRLEPDGGIITSPGLYASFMWVDNLTLSSLKIGQLSQIKLEDITLLHETGAISSVQQSKNKTNHFSVEQIGLPTQVLFEVTSECQCGCMHCYHKLDLNRGAPKIGDLIKRIDVLSNLGLTLFEITGGEPLLRSDLGEILNRVRENGRNFYLVTNGGNLKNCKDSMVEILKKGEGIALSIDGFGKNHDTIRAKAGLFEDIVNGLKRFQGSDIPFYFITTIGEHNYQDVPKLLDFASQYGAKLHLRPVIGTGNAVSSGLKSIKIHELLKDYLTHPSAKNGFIATKKTIPESKYYGCGIRKRISVNAFGEFFPCVMDRFSKGQRIEDYTPQSLVTYLATETKKYLNYNPSCNNCKINTNEIVCGGFCRFSQTLKNATTTKL